MELLVIILNKPELLNELLSVLVEAGISKATILDSEGLGQHLAYEVPIFAGLRKFVGEGRTFNKTILALMDDSGRMQELQKLLKGLGIDFEKDGMGVLFTLPVNNVVGSKENKNP
jgi:nitrogen regulatory protein PII